ncbi:putative dsRNA-binding protein [Candidatus Neptunichlamydia sp. REUL1]|uniref:putative dsRNA-binding protein n=1 Tax=Candidatus Neptunichlamydia sp. REUL1 TaxID=3064277 RepID=UPI002931E918|nr:putative dsRNA-binding protein [Candidatus Neptunochlamydia sp. REUL1]
MTNLAMQMVSSLQKNISNIEESLSHKFNNTDLLMRAFMDSSFPLVGMVSDGGETNEDFVWRGNYILQLVVADSIKANHHAADKATKNTMLNKHISNDAHIKYLDKLQVFNHYLYQCPHGLINPDAQIAPFKEKCFKAILTAVYLDAGKSLEPIHGMFVDKFNIELEDSLEFAEKNWKSLLNEWAQKNRMGQLIFSLAERNGPDHAPMFKVKLTLNGDDISTGESTSKKQAEQIAAKTAYEKLVPKP